MTEGEKLKHLIDTKMITQKELAEVLGMSKQSLYYFYKQSHISKEYKDKIALKLGLSDDYFTQKNIEKSDNYTVKLIQVLENQVEELKATNEFLKTLVLTKLDRLERLNFGINEGGTLGKIEDMYLVVE